MSSASASGSRRGRPGRPRLLPQQHSGTPREQILDAAAGLFTSRGYAATSTREIADAVGIRQASLYYHFAGKGEILTELLGQTIRPTVDSVARIESLTDDPDTALYLLALIDVRTLAQAPYNIGWLYLAPDVAQVEGFEDFAAARDDLAATYARLAEPIAAPDVLALVTRARLGEMLVHAVEEVIGLRNAGQRIDVTEAVGIASSCLRLCGVDSARIELAMKTAETLLDQIDGTDPDGPIRG
ncbi:TetR/AcrR family transcriptional regulator [Nocardioides sp. NPDC000445]|uniref:TetR/AcrR family transcriptional regulator n=1 Tax=Nocardioides sp. NPDC000445 TaxID=3154257 RepID=UPI00332927DF